MPQSHTSLAVIHFWGPLWNALSSACKIRECCIWIVIKVVIYFQSMSFIDSKWSILSASGSYTLFCLSLLGSIMECPFRCMQEKECCIWIVIKVKIYFQNMGFIDSKWSNLNAPGSYTPCCHSLLGSIVGCPFLCMQENGCCMWLLNKVETHFAKVGFVDCKWSNLNAPGSYALWCHSLLGSGVYWCPFPAWKKRALQNRPQE